MAVKIRLTRLGKKSDPKYRIVVAESGKKRDGAYIEKIGFYDPIMVPHQLEINMDKLNGWLSKGAVLSDGAQKLLKNYSKKK